MKKIEKLVRKKFRFVNLQDIALEFVTNNELDKVVHQMIIRRSLLNKDDSELFPTSLSPLDINDPAIAVKFLLDNY